MKKLTVVVAAVAALAATTARAEEPARRFSIAPLVGAYVPTGDHRDILEDSVLAGLTLSYDVHPNVAVVGAFSWAPTKTRGVLGEQDLDLLQYDLGVQGQLPVLLAPGWTVKPFVGVGVGGRTYEYRNVGTSGQTVLAGYVSARSPKRSCTVVLAKSCFTSRSARWAAISRAAIMANFRSPRTAEPMIPFWLIRGMFISRFSMK